ncbi:MAG TPA: glycosyltransferase family 2 protein, partial [Flavobacteriales bacterium]|nr:glycosyltransferase family 2 protein [Flavobacteriales bacterium]
MEVSVVIPCHNVEDLLPKAVRSVLDQQHAVAELVLVDDGSTDGTWAVIEELSQEAGPVVRSVRQAQQGASAARNAGLRLCSGEWVQFLDADDVLYPPKIREQLLLADAADLVVGDYEKVMPDGLLLTVEALYDRPWMALIKTRLGTTSANLWRRSAVEAAGGW